MPVVVKKVFLFEKRKEKKEKKKTQKKKKERRRRRKKEIPISLLINVVYKLRLNFCLWILMEFRKIF